MIQTKIHRKHLYTPLRYPGGKSSLFGFFSHVIQAHDWKNVTYIEPYAGGAGAGLSLLILGLVDHVVINDRDEAIFSFWKAVTENPQELIRRIQTTPLTVEEWRRQKDIYKKKKIGLDLGFATFYLNRTNRSGVLNAGPIGGLNQNGNWKIDARFDRGSLASKIALIASHKDSITVLNEDGVDVIRRYTNDPSVFFYIDPPYYQKGAMLYLNSFDHNKHQELADLLNSLPNVRWLLSYDAAPEIKSMYAPQGRKMEVFSLRYSVHQNTKSGSELMVFSDAIDTSLLASD